MEINGWTEHGAPPKDTLIHFIYSPSPITTASIKVTTSIFDSGGFFEKNITTSKVQEKMHYSAFLIFLLSSSTTLSSSFDISFRSRITRSNNSKKSALNMKIPLEKLTNHANSYAAANGLQVEVKRDKTDSKSVAYQCAPISLLPNAFPSSAFQDAKCLAPYFNLLVDRISKDGAFLHDTLGGEHGVISKDDYTKKLLELYTDIYMKKGDIRPNFAKEADALGITRSDYMLNPIDGNIENGYGLKQVELNTIAASFAGLAVNVAGLHKQLTERFDLELEVSFCQS